MSEIDRLAHAYRTAEAAVKLAQDIVTQKRTEGFAAVAAYESAKVARDKAFEVLHDTILSGVERSKQIF